MKTELRRCLKGLRKTISSKLLPP